MPVFAVVLAPTSMAIETMELPTTTGLLQSMEGASSNEDSGTTISRCNSGTVAESDPDLLVHYDFDNNVNDVRNAYGDGRYNIKYWRNIKYAQGCAYGNAAYFDATTGHLFNDDFIDDNETSLSENFTVSAWVYADSETLNSLTAYSTGNGSGRDHQLDLNLNYTTHSIVVRWALMIQLQVVNVNTSNLSGAASCQWELFKNGVSIGTRNTPSPATWTKLKLVSIGKKVVNGWAMLMSLRFTEELWD